MEKKFIFLTVLVFLFIGACTTGDNQLTKQEQKEGWELLFNGRTLDGWHDYNGDSLTGPWSVENGIIKAEGHGDDLNGYIVTEKEYDNFILSWDWKISEGGNSGMLYHVVQHKKYAVPYLTGPEYQIIDDINFPQPLEEWQKCAADYAMYLPDKTKMKVNPAGEWNTSKIVFDNGEVEYWINGEKIIAFEAWSADWFSRKEAGKWKNAPDYGLSPTGVICLQDHGYPAWFKNIKIKKLERKEKEEWLFNGTSIDSWRGIESDSFPQKGWKIVGDELIVMAQEGNIPAGADIITKKMFSNFILELDYKLTTHANSGIKYFVTNNIPGYEGQFLGLEYQIIDEASYTEEELGNTLGNHKTGSLYELVPAPADKLINPPGEWNHVKLVVDGRNAEHWLNGKKMIDYERGSEAFRILVAKSKYSVYKDFGESPRGHILLQGHNGEVAFKAIKIRHW